jgi:hypothetical protein
MWCANTSEATEGDGTVKATRVGGKLAAAAVVAGLIVGPASADAKILYPYTQATTSSQGAVPQPGAESIPQSVETGRKVH